MTHLNEIQVDRTEVRELPKNIEAEQVVLGAIILEPERTAPVAIDRHLLPEHFYDRRHGVIYSAMMDLFINNIPSDIVILANHLESKGEMEMAGGRIYLNELLDRTTTTASLEFYINIIIGKAALRDVITAGLRIEELGYHESTDALDIISQANEIISTVEIQGSKPPYTRLGDEMQNQIVKLEKISNSGGGVIGVPSGFGELDKITSGFRDSDLVVIAARPGVGKSSLATSIVRRCSLDGYKVGFFSLEMSNEQTLNRLLCAEARISLQKMRGGFMGIEDWRKLNDIAPRIADAPIYVDSTPGSTLMDIVLKVRMMKEREEIDIVFIDYLQLIEIHGYSRDRQNEVAQISRTLKKLALELDIPIIALSQLNRNTEGRSNKNKRPTLADLRESGAIEQDADMVIFIYREDYYDKDNDLQDSIVPTELIIAKQRNGPVGRVYISFHKHFVDFYPNVYVNEADEAKFAWNSIM